MDFISNSNPDSRDFLLKLFDQVGADVSVQTSMYDVGASVGLDKDASSTAAEELIGWGLVEVKTLSGGIGITDDGIQIAHQLGAGPQSNEMSGLSLGNEVIMDATLCAGVDNVLAALKVWAGSSGAEFNDLAELTSDIKTADAQLGSPQPKTAIIRECLKSLQSVLEKHNAEEQVRAVNQLLGE